MGAGRETISHEKGVEGQSGHSHSTAFQEPTPRVQFAYFVLYFVFHDGWSMASRPLLQCRHDREIMDFGDVQKARLWHSSSNDILILRQRLIQIQ